MHKPIHEVYYYGNERTEQDMTGDEFTAWFEAELAHHDVKVYVGTHEKGCWMVIKRGMSIKPLLGHLYFWKRLEYGWSTYTINEEG